MNTYSSAQRAYFRFCSEHQLPPFPFTEHLACLFIAHLAQKGLRPQSISAYLSGIRHLQITIGETTSQRSQWPRLQYVLRGIKRSGSGLPHRVRLPITSHLMSRIHQSLFPPNCSNIPFNTRLIWAACCLGFFGFLRCGEFTLSHPSDQPPILSTGVVVDSYSCPTTLALFLRRAKCDPFGKGVYIYVGKTDSTICPVSAILLYLAVRPSPPGPLFVWEDGSPLTRDAFINWPLLQLYLDFVLVSIEKGLTDSTSVGLWEVDQFK